MTFSILDFLDQLEPSKEGGKFICPACGGNDFSVNKKNGAYSCWHDTSPAHRAEIRDALAPMVRWEKPKRDPGYYTFPYRNTIGEEVVIVHRDDKSGTKHIWQDFPSIDKNSTNHKGQLQEVKANVLPYRYNDAIAESDKTGLPIIVVEGELTCEAVWAVGLPSITFLGGSKQYRTNGDYSALFKNKKLVLAPDRDEHGVAFMKEVEVDNPGASWLYADPRSWEWKNLPSGDGLDLADYIEEGATKEDLLASIVSKSKHSGVDGKPAYEEIISAVENFVGLYANDARIAYETGNWLEQRGVKMNQGNVEKIIEEAKSRIYGREEIETIDALAIANADQCREWLIAGIMPLGSVMLLAASGGTGKSTIVYNWALNIALGQSWSGRRCMQGKSLIIQSDEPLVDTSEKLNVIGYQDANLEPGTVAFWENWRFGHMKQLEDYVRKNRPVFIAIDSLTACLAGMDVDLVKSNAGDVIYGLRDIANQYKCSIAILHHLNKSGGLRDSTSFVDNVSEVVKLTKSENNPDPNQFTMEWLKSRSGLTGKHYLQRDTLSYGWRYAGPASGSLDALDRVVNAVNMRKNERLSRQQVASITGSFEISTTGKMLEVARRQGLITSSFLSGPNGEHPRVYHSWEYAGTMEETMEESFVPPIEEANSEEKEEWFF
ncbi:Archaeal primase DnaG/twinkle, TOPRIM domain [uncultured Caudovirales phage]|uniref:Archaeal primase DnaG/twinkle, TOPRIM domain n=1 Tax=uncultured Caudovirales phage TaxID=2100421 RepID=A0A6J7X803_9CAUD|nr:Archaeal primase DnaG/twinkle, TOPRIM domain [uncultured Caudovirales phage]